MYNNWGFSTSPFDTSPLPADEFGEKLLVGRSNVAERLKARVRSGRKACTIEGLNGVGKTSIVNVSSYQLFKEHVVDENKPLFIPCRSTFQLREDQSTEDFVFNVLLEIAQTLIEKKEEIRREGHFLRTNAIDRWINYSQDISYQGGVWGVSGGRTEAANTGAGFEKSGFRKALLAWLNQIFPADKDGAVVCTIDNLEILQHSKVARKILENIRDEIFNLPGVRWILCGSLGIVRGIVTSPRLDGYVHDPLEVGEIADHHCREIIVRRIEAYRSNAKETYLPVTVDSFEKLYEILNGNIRSTLNRTDEFCLWVSERSKPKTDEEKDAMFADWLAREAQEEYETVKHFVKPRALSVFRACCEKNVFSTSDYEDFGFNNIDSFRPHVKVLQEVGLLMSSEDPTDKRRKTIEVSAKGRLTNFHLASNALY